LWDWTAFFHYLVSPYLVMGAAITLGVSVAAILLGLLCGLIAALMRHSARPVDRHGAYSDDAARVFQPSSAHRSNLMPPTIPI
jgi:ABC-type amino acid transport system permease subunit